MTQDLMYVEEALYSSLKKTVSTLKSEHNRKKLGAMVQDNLNSFLGLSCTEQKQ